jgi:hypothetical protein
MIQLYYLHEFLGGTLREEELLNTNVLRARRREHETDHGFDQTNLELVGASSLHCTVQLEGELMLMTHI